MATKLMKKGSMGVVAPPPIMVLNEDGTVPPEAILGLNRTVATLISAINSGLSMGDGANGYQTGSIRNQWLSFVTPSAADEEFEMPHGLNRTPVGINTWFVDKGAVIYISNYGSWTNTRLLLKCNTASVSCVIEVG